MIQQTKYNGVIPFNTDKLLDTARETKEDVGLINNDLHLKNLKQLLHTTKMSMYNKSNIKETDEHFSN